MELTNKIKSGFMLLEIIIAIAIISIAFISLIGVILLSVNVSMSVRKETQANSLMIEEVEALRSFRDGTQWASNGLGTAAVGSNNLYHLSSSSNSWALVTGAETAGIFTRQAYFENVSRNASSDIEAVYNPLNNDNDTKKITIIISWPDKTMKDVLYLTNWKNN